LTQISFDTLIEIDSIIEPEYYKILAQQISQAINCAIINVCNNTDYKLSNLYTSIDDFDKIGHANIAYDENDIKNIEFGVLEDE
jgi:hypothetical protein